MTRSPRDLLEDAIIDLEGSVFLVDQFVAHGEHTDDAERALHHVNRLLAADMKAVREAFTRVLYPNSDKPSGPGEVVHLNRPDGDAA